MESVQLDDLSNLLSAKRANPPGSDDYAATLFYPARPEDRVALAELVRDTRPLYVHDTVREQLREWIVLQHVSKPLATGELEAQIAAELGEQPEYYGVWAYYPWSSRLVHLLPEEKFIAVRTARNKHKITEAEQAALAGKRIGVIGLSVGQSAALTIAMERGCRELRLADFDRLDLGNLNRIRCGVHELGGEKVINTAREIAELDPFLEITVYRDGITGNNIDAFLTSPEKLDLLVEECDSIDIKILSRERARSYGMPVVMETSDRGMIDIERFDLEAERPLLHGFAGDLTHKQVLAMGEAQKIPLVLKLTDAHRGSLRGKASMLEINQSISTWPQLASSVVIGGGLVADVSRRILTGKLAVSGRFYLDPEGAIPSVETLEKAPDSKDDRPGVPERGDLEASMEAYFSASRPRGAAALEKEILDKILSAAEAAPSTGNDQPWLFAYHDGVLFLFHDRSRSYSFGNYKNMASDLTFGAVSANISLRARTLGYRVVEDFRPLGDDNPLEIAFRFEARNDLAVSEAEMGMDSAIARRFTNRAPSVGERIPDAVMQMLEETAAADQDGRLVLLRDDASIRKAMGIVAECDRLRLMSEAGHHDFLHREMRFSAPGAPAPEDGIDISTLGLSRTQLAIFPLIRDYRLIRFLKEIGGGKIFGSAGLPQAGGLPYIALLTTHSTAPNRYYEAGKTYERFWLAAEAAGVAVHPQISPVYLFSRLDGADSHGFTAEDVAHLSELQNSFRQLFNLSPEEFPTFLTRIGIAHEQTPRAGRRKRDDIFFTR